MRPDYSEILPWKTKINEAARAGNAEEAEKLLNDMIADYRKSGNLAVRPDTGAFNSVVDAWARKKVLERADEVVSRMKDLARPPHNWDTEPDVITYSTVIKCLTNVSQNDKQRSSERVKEIFLDIQRRYQEGDASFQPNTPLFNSVLNFYATNGDAANAESLLEEMYRDYVNGNKLAAPNFISFSTVLKAWSRKSNPNSKAVFARMIAIKERMVELHSSGKLKTKPTRSTYMSLIGFCVNSDQPDSVGQAEALLREMTNMGLHADERVYSLVLQAYVKKGNGARAEAIVEEITSAFVANKENAVKPISSFYNMVIAAWAKSRDKMAPQRAEQVLSRMWKLHSTPDLRFIKPDKTSYNYLLQCWRNSGHSAEQVEKVFRRMLKKYDAGDSDMAPSVVSALIVMNCYSMEGNVKKVRSLLDELTDEDPVRGRALVKAGASLYNALLIALTHSRDKATAAVQAEATMAKMMELVEKGDHDAQPNAVSYNSLISCLANSRAKGAAERAETYLREIIEKSKEWGTVDLTANKINYVMVMKAYGYEGNAQKAESLLYELYDYYLSTGNLKPDVTNFNLVLNAWSKSSSPGAPERCEAILNRMRELDDLGQLPVRPDTISYNTVINSWTRSKRVDSTDQVERLLQEMKDRYTSGDSYVKPTFRTYNSIFSAYLLSQRRGENGTYPAERVLGLLDEMLDLAAEGDKDVAPTNISYERVLSTIYYSQLSDKMEQFKRVLRLMKDQGVAPSIHIRQLKTKALGGQAE